MPGKKRSSSKKRTSPVAKEVETVIEVPEVSLAPSPKMAETEVKKNRSKSKSKTKSKKE